jgi:hypothetical protein
VTLHCRVVRRHPAVAQMQRPGNPRAIDRRLERRDVARAQQRHGEAVLAMQRQQLLEPLHGGGELRDDQVAAAGEHNVLAEGA